MRITFWIIPFLLLTLQAVMTFSSTNQIRYEELAESARNPFWMSQGVVYDGVSTSVWWYLSQDLFFNLFGYDLFATKFLRLGLWFVSLICLSALLKKWMGEKYGWLPLLVIGLSPTILFFNTLQTSYGLDLVYLPIVLWLVTGQLGWLGILGRLGGWFLAMIAWLTYPPFVFYLPGLAWVGGLRGMRGVGGVGVIAAFLAPFLIALLWIKNKATFLNDPESSSGVFRGAGSGISFDNILTHLTSFIQDFFAKGQSYHFEVGTGEFSYFLPILSFLVVMWMSVKILIDSGIRRNDRWVVAVLLLTMAGALLVTFLTGGLPGMRRYTPILASFYGLFIFVWSYILRSAQDDKKKIMILAAGGILLAHHLIAYPINLAALKEPSPSMEPYFFAADPQTNLNNLVDRVQKEDLKLSCQENGKPFKCRYNEVYGAIASKCLWSKRSLPLLRRGELECHQIYGYDVTTRQFIPLSVEYKDEY